MDLKIKRIVRQAAAARSNCPIEVVPGDAAPRLVGTRPHHRTKGGDVIQHPSAYSRRGWSNMVYMPSTVRVVVGQQWVETNNDKETK